MLFDGQIYRKNYHIVTFIDQWVKRGEIPPLYVVMVDSISSEQRGKELPPNEQFPQFLDEELMQWLAQKGINIPGADHCFRQQLRRSCVFLECDEITSPFRQCAEYVRILLVVTGGRAAGMADSRVCRYSQTSAAVFLEAGVFETRAGAGGILHNNRALYQVLQEKVTRLPVRSPGGHDYVSWCETLHSG